jgi:hypothetical protein
MPSNKEYLLAVFFGGLFIGVLSSLPGVNLANLCCCLWMICGGVVAAYVLQNGSPVSITIGDGALVGFGAGVAGAGLWLVLAVPMFMLGGSIEAHLFRGGAAGAEVPGAFRALAGGTNLSAAGLFPFFLVVFLFMLVGGGVAATLGGMAGAAFFRPGRARQAPPAPPSPPRPPVLPPPTPDE